MTGLEFIAVLSETYGEPIIKDGKDNLKLKFIKKWADGFTPAELDTVIEKTIKGFMPTSTNPCPLIPHIIDICELDTTEKSKTELARTVADKTIHAVMNIGFREAGCRVMAHKFIGDLGWRVVYDMYGEWRMACETIEKESVEVTRSHLRDSALAYINRAEKGLQDKTPELSDLSHNQIAIGNNNDI